MKSQILNISINDNIVEYTANYIIKVSNKNIDFSDLLVVMPSKRPALFLKKEISKKIKTTYIPPKFFTIDELVTETDKKNSKRKLISEIDSAYIIYKIVKNNIENNDFFSTNFSGFFDWSYEILKFINFLDEEKIDNSKLLNLKLNADIGYDLPKNINDLLKQLHVIRKEFHKELDNLNKTTLGYSYFNADKKIAEYLKEYKRIILFNPYYLNKAEVDLFRTVYDENKLDIIIKGNAKDWTALKKIYQDFEIDNISQVRDIGNYNIDIYSVNDDQTQACLLKNLIANIPKEERERTVVVVPDNSVLQTIMSQLYSIEKNINIAAGYPAKKTTIFSLFMALIKAQKNKNDDKYYVKDIVSIMANPLVKNMRFIGNPEVTRIIVHEIIDNFDRFNSEALFKGSQFVSLKKIIDSNLLCDKISKKISSYWEYVSCEKVKEIISEMFNLFVINFDKARSMKDFGKNIKDIVDNISDKSLINTYAFNIGAINVLYDISEQFVNSICCDEIFDTKELLNILEKFLAKMNINLIGSPLKGLQVLGLMESRGLSFDNVFVLSMTDTILPNITEISPLVPKEVSNLLGIGYKDKDIDIQRYHFMSLISGAKKVSLIYTKSGDAAKSRFIEELVWKKQLKEKKLDAVKITDGVIFNSVIKQSKTEYPKTKEIKKYLADFEYSATSIDTYMQCKLKFYYKYILRLNEQVDYDNDYEHIDIGICVHDFLRKVFCKGLKHDYLTQESFKQNYIEKLDLNLNLFFDNGRTGNVFLLKKLIKNRMSFLYNNEIKRDFKEIFDVEFDVRETLDVDGTKYKLKARIDRADINKDDNIDIIDYKTGKVERPLYKVFSDADNYTRETINNNIRSFQLVVYKYLYESKYAKVVDNCKLYSLKDCTMYELFDEKVDKKKVFESTIKQLKYIIAEINSDEVFKSESYDSTNCEQCPYFYLCR